MLWQKLDRIKTHWSLNCVHKILMRLLKANGILRNIIIFGKSHIFYCNEVWPSWFRPTLKIGRSTPMLFPLFPSSWWEWLAQKWADIKVLRCRSLKQMFFPPFWGSEATLSLFLIVPYENKAFLANLAVHKLNRMFFYHEKWFLAYLSYI